MKIVRNAFNLFFSTTGVKGTASNVFEAATSLGLGQSWTRTLWLFALAQVAPSIGEAIRLGLSIKEFVWDGFESIREPPKDLQVYRYGIDALSDAIERIAETRANGQSNKRMSGLSRPRWSARTCGARRRFSTTCSTETTRCSQMRSSDKWPRTKTFAWGPPEKPDDPRRQPDAEPQPVEAHGQRAERRGLAREPSPRRASRFLTRSRSRHTPPPPGPTAASSAARSCSSRCAPTRSTPATCCRTWRGSWRGCDAPSRSCERSCRP